MKVTKMTPAFLCLSVCVFCFCTSAAEPSLNNRPIIGVLAQEFRSWSYIAASYVKFVEGSGARVVPIMINQSWSYYEDIVNHVNGILLPGGGVYFNVTGGYAEAGSILYNLTIEKNKNGDYFPFWGTCLGFELITFAAVNGEEHRMRCDHYNKAVPLEVKLGTFNSRLFGSASHEIIGILVKENVTANFHKYCTTMQNMTVLGLDKEWNFMTLNHDSNGMEYISTLEHRDFPIYGVQFHPEKNNYEWKISKNHPHFPEGIRISQYFGNFFVNEGVLSQELSDYMHDKYPGNHSSYIAASYIKFVEGAGARAVPILINQTESYYEDLVNSVNGVLFPGGAASFKTKNGYADAAWTLYKLAIRKNQAGEYFPVWGTCLGFELLSFLATQQVNILTNCEAENVAMPLQFKPDFGTSKMFGEAPDNIIQILETENVTANYHHFCITETNFTTAGLSRDWRVISVNKDVNDLEFISSFEHKQYPIYGVQFHPEKNTYEWKLTNNNPHSANAILVEEFFADFFVNEARKSSHHFPTQRDEEQALIYNFQPEYTGWNGSSFEQIYFF